MLGNSNIPLHNLQKIIPGVEIMFIYINRLYWGIKVN